MLPTMVWPWSFTADLCSHCTQLVVYYWWNVYVGREWDEEGREDGCEMGGVDGGMGRGGERG